jgi:hypothetical protein
MAGNQGAKFGNKNAAGHHVGHGRGLPPPPKFMHAVLSGAAQAATVHAAINGYHNRKVHTGGHAIGAMLGAGIAGGIGGGVMGAVSGAGLGLVAGSVGSKVGGWAGKKMRQRTL